MKRSEKSKGEKDKLEAEKRRRAHIKKMREAATGQLNESSRRLRAAETAMSRERPHLARRS